MKCPNCDRTHSEERCPECEYQDPTYEEMEDMYQEHLNDTKIHTLYLTGMEIRHVKETLINAGKDHVLTVVLDKIGTLDC